MTSQSVDYFSQNREFFPGGENRAGIGKIALRVFLNERSGGFRYCFPIQSLGLGCPIEMMKTALNRDFFIQKLDIFN